jgi:hypothetical protein
MNGTYYKFNLKQTLKRNMGKIRNRYNCIIFNALLFLVIALPKITLTQDNPYYCIAIHSEPWNPVEIADNYINLESMVLNANQYNIKKL